MWQCLRLRMCDLQQQLRVRVPMCDLQQRMWVRFSVWLLRMRCFLQRLPFLERLPGRKLRLRWSFNGFLRRRSHEHDG
jgi:hypothetical protein